MGVTPAKPPAAEMPRLSLPVVVALVAGAFIWGHHATQRQPAGAAAPPPAASGRGARDIGEWGQEFLQSSGLLAARPPLPPAESGSEFYTVQPFQVLSWWPRIVVYPNFIDPARCQRIIDLARGKLERSGLAWRPTEAPDENQDTRTSSGTFLDAREDNEGVLDWLEEKIAAVTLLPVSHGEAFNVLRYDSGAHYDSHMVGGLVTCIDSFDPKDFGEQPSQRMATVLVYLSDVEEGGETVFLKEGKRNAEKEVYDFKACDSGFKYKPRLGDAVLFYSLDPDLTINPRSLHGGCPVIKGEKWVATKWIHEKPFRPT